MLTWNQEYTVTSVESVKNEDWPEMTPKAPEEGLTLSTVPVLFEYYLGCLALLLTCLTPSKVTW